MDKYLVLVNRNNKFVEENNLFNLVSVDSEYINDVLLENETYIQYKKLEKFMADNGFYIACESGYRSCNEQEEVYNEFLAMYSPEYVEKYVARPGFSEHQTGLAVDVCLKEGDVWLTDTDITVNHPMLMLLHKSLWKYGFILRYPKNKEDITGYGYEPWHIRYIGDIKIAKFIYANDLCLEEYLNANY